MPENLVQSPDHTPQRFIMLGASNLTMSFPLILENLRRQLEGPIKVYAALGHGRSFGQWSRVFVRGLPGISESGMWEHFDQDQHASGPVRALITDIGNDLIYDVPVPQIAKWLDHNLARLAKCQAETVVTLLPLGSVEKLQAWRYYLTRTLMFPTRNCPWPEMRRRIFELNDRLQELCARYNARTFTPPGDWYGFDPIHIVRSQRAQAWTDILSLWSGLSTTERFRPASLGMTSRFLRSCPAERRLFGLSQKRTQPAFEWDDVSVALF